jgi:hypothetical protein
MAQRLTIELPPPVARIDDLADRERSACPSPKISPSRHSSNSRSFTTKPNPGALRLLFSQDVATDWWLELQLLFMTMISGILDSVTYTTYNVFTTKQTGKSIAFIVVREWSADDVRQATSSSSRSMYSAKKRWQKKSSRPSPCRSVGTHRPYHSTYMDGRKTRLTYAPRSFIIGSFVFGQLAHRVRTRKRGWLILTTFIQALFILVVALVARSSEEPRKGTGPRALAIVGLLSFAQAGQVSLAIGVGLAELNTTMITGAVVSNQSPLPSFDSTSFILT